MRMRLVVGFILLFFIFLLSRVYYLSIKSNVYYEELAKQNAIKTETIYAHPKILIFSSPI
ncbi:hypothetical protein FZ441_01550 [Campylobacter jejuni]|nr:hypothetical protein [Campylobacter jejuni]